MEKVMVDNHCNGVWTTFVDNTLKELVFVHGNKQWSNIAKQMPIDTTGKACKHRWYMLSGSGVKGHWRDEEDRIIVEAVNQGMNKWSEIAKLTPGRIGKQCRERWFNHLSPELKKTPWTSLEDDLLIEAQARLGNSWSKVTLEIPGRSENEVKNRWYSAVIRRKLSDSIFTAGTDRPRQDEVTSNHKRPADYDLVRINPRTVSFPDVPVVAASRAMDSTAESPQLKKPRFSLTEDDLISLHIAELYLQGILSGRIVDASADATGLKGASSSAPKVKHERYLVPEVTDKVGGIIICSFRFNEIATQNSICSMDTIQRDFQKYCTRFQEGIGGNCSGVMDSISGLTTPYCLSVSCSPLWAGLISSPASPK